MNCQSCGAPMKLVPRRDHLFCEYCGAVSYAEPDQDVLVFLKEPADEECPSCDVPLLKASIEGLPLSACAVLWLDKGKLQRIASVCEGPTP